jgi:hypothetical protein
MLTVRKVVKVVMRAWASLRGMRTGTVSGWGETEGLDVRGGWDMIAWTCLLLVEALSQANSRLNGNLESG